MAQAARPTRGEAFIAAHVWSLGVAHSRYPDAADRFVDGVSGCREVQDAFVTELKIPSSEARERDGSVWLQVRGSLHTKVSDSLIAHGLVTSALAGECYGGQDPSKVDPHLSRLVDGPARGFDAGRFHRDVDRRLRMRANVDAAPRYDDPRFYDRLVVGLEATGASGAIRRMCGLARFAGARSCQVRPLTLHDAFVMPGEGKVGVEIKAPNKGSRGDRRMTLIPNESEMDAILEYVAGERAELSGVPLDEIRLMAADKRQRGRLKKMPLFTEDGVNHLRYPRLYRVFRLAAEHAGLWIDDEDYRETGRKRHVTFHYLRHEYVHSRLDGVAALPTLAEQQAERKAIWTYMCWRSGESMLNWYSAHHVVKGARAGAERHNERSDSGLAENAISPRDLERVRSEAEVRVMLEGLL